MSNLNNVNKMDKMDFDYSSKESREALIPLLFEDAKSERSTVELLWRTYDAYYDGIHKTLNEIKDNLTEDELSEALNSNILTDPFIHVESQIDPTVPEPEFRGRDYKQDKDKAKQREYVVKYIMGRNDLESTTTENERRLRKYGDSFAKVYYDDNVINEYGRIDGDIKVCFINTDDIFPDPTAKCIEDCEYIIHANYMHIQKVKRIYGKDLKKAGIEFERLGTDNKSITQPVSDSTKKVDCEVLVMEHWYKDDDGDIALSIIVDHKEIRHIPKYWKNTGRQNKCYPFIHYYRIRDERSFWNTAELKAIIPLVNTADRILRLALNNMELMGNDVWIKAENALSDNGEITNEAGGVIETTVAGFNQVRRAGGLNSLRQFIPEIQFIQDQIQRTVRNFDTNQGKEAIRTTTASGLAQLRADAAQQSSIKDSDRMQAWKRLFMLIDWFALEFYDEDKMIFIGVPENQSATLQEGAVENLDTKQGDVFFTFNSERLRQEIEPDDEEIEMLIESGEEMPEKEYYYPSIDCEVNASNGVEKSKSFTVQVLQAMVETQITAMNYKIVVKLIDELNISHSKDLIEWIEQMYGSQVFTPEEEQMINAMPPEAQAQIRSNPRLFDKAKQLAQGQSQPQQII